jgi:hypothetical protein
VHDEGAPHAILPSVDPSFPNSATAMSAGPHLQSARERLVYPFADRDLACAWTQLTTDMAALRSPAE